MRTEYLAGSAKVEDVLVLSDDRRRTEEKAAQLPADVIRGLAGLPRWEGPDHER